MSIVERSSVACISMFHDELGVLSAEDLSRPVATLPPPVAEPSLSCQHYHLTLVLAFASHSPTIPLALANSPLRQLQQIVL